MENLLSSIKMLGFLSKEGTSNIYSKKYRDYEITISYNDRFPEKSEINYGSKILCHRRTTCNFHQDESFVVLECVNREGGRSRSPFWKNCVHGWMNRKRRQ